MKPHTNGSRITGKGRARALGIAGVLGLAGVVSLMDGCRGDDIFDDVGHHGHHGGSGGTTGAGGASPAGGGQVGDACGGLAGNLRPCARGLFCEGALACAPDAGGTCQRRPDVCTDIYAPVCGCDRMTYGNDCVRQTAGVSKLSDGACPVDGTGGAGDSGGGGGGAGGATGLGQVGDACGGFIANARPCAKGLFCDGPFPELACVPDVGGTCRERPEICYDLFAPVCGCDCKTYGNDCQRQSAGVSKRADGACDGVKGC
jgi:Kazal-type serine protease inhibitor-like protein